MAGNEIMTTVLKQCETVYTQLNSVSAGTLILESSSFGLHVCAGSFGTRI